MAKAYGHRVGHPVYPTTPPYAPVCNRCGKPVVQWGRRSTAKHSNYRQTLGWKHKG